MKNPFKKQIALLFLLTTCFVNSSQAGEAVAWLQREPKSFDECILQNMKGVTSDRAATFIRLACKEKFPNKQNQLFGEPYVPPQPIPFERLHPSLKVLSGKFTKNRHGLGVLRLHAQNNTRHACPEIRLFYEPSASKCSARPPDEMIKGPIGKVVSGSTDPKSQFFVDFDSSHILAHEICYIAYCYGYK